MIVIPIIVSIILGVFIKYGIIDNNGIVQLQSPPLTYGTGLMFDTIASRYDIINRILALGMDINWRISQVNSIKSSTLIRNNKENNITNNIIDIATGTADVAIHIGKHIPNSNIIGIDPSNNMLSIGRTKVTKQQTILSQYNTTIRLVQADAQYLVGTNTTIIVPSSNNENEKKNDNSDTEETTTTTVTIQKDYFHAGTMSFGIRNVPDRVRALCEIHTVLVRNAQLNILEFSNPIWETFDTDIDSTKKIQTKISSYIGVYVVSNFIQYIIPTMGGILSGKPRAYWHLQKSIANFPKPNDFIQLVQNLHCPQTQNQHQEPDKIVNIDDTTTDTTTTTVIKSFAIKNVQHFNFGSVQLYELIVVK